MAASRFYLICRTLLAAAAGLVVTVGPANAAPVEWLLPAAYPSTTTPGPLALELGETEVVPRPESDAPNASEIPPPAPPEADPLDVHLEVDEPAPWYQPTTWLRDAGWDTAVELGLNGSSGTSESLSIRAGGYSKFESDYRKLNFDIYHNRTQAGGLETQNNARANFRHDWLRPDSPWTVYVQSQLYYDEFQAFDLNLNVNGGAGYRFLREDWIELAGRFGSGASREFGGVDDQWVPEAQFGIDYEQQLASNQKLYATVDYFPEWGDFSRYRLLTDVGWEVELEVPSRVSLKVAATDRFDSHPDGVDPHNLNYSVLLLWKL